MKNDKTSLIKNALTVSMGGFIAKVLGAIYRIPLTNILGGDGMGLYQMVFPLYCVLLTFSSTGLPSSISKIISEGNSADKVLKKAMRVFGCVGFSGTLFMSLFSVVIAKLQGSPNVWSEYVVLSPCVFFVSLISCFRGYFQGNGNMIPTAKSQIVEQAVKLFLGLFVALLFKENITLSVTTSVAAVSVSEVVALLYLITEKNKYGLSTTESNIPDGNGIVVLKESTTSLNFPLNSLKYNEKTGNAYQNEVIDEEKSRISAKRLLSVVFPITLTSILIPLSRVLDSFLCVNIISSYSAKATKLYGLYSGGVESIIGVPISICYGIPVALIPIITSALKSGNKEKSKKIAKSAILYTLLLSCAFAACVAAFSPLAVKILYFALDAQSKSTLVSLLRLSSLSIVFLSCVQTFNAIRISENKLYLPTVFLGVGITVKTIVLLVLLPNAEINIFAVAISDILCYFVACFCNLGYYISENLRKRKKITSLKTKIETL